jgi:hypothetical protein
MTHEEKIAIDVLNIRDRHGSMEEIVQRIEQGLQAQREECAERAVQYAGEFFTSEGLFIILSNRILNARVQP